VDHITARVREIIPAPLNNIPILEDQSEWQEPIGISQRRHFLIPNKYFTSTHSSKRSGTGICPSR
jgi:hypothetical protein